MNFWGDIQTGVDGLKDIQECLEVSKIDTSYFVLYYLFLLSYTISQLQLPFPSLPLNLPTSPLPQTYWFSISTQKRAGLPILCKMGVTEIIFWPWNLSNNNGTGFIYKVLWIGCFLWNLWYHGMFLDKYVHSDICMNIVNLRSEWWVLSEL